AAIGTAIGMEEIGMSAIGITTTTTATLIISFSYAALAYRSSAIRMAMDIILTAMAILPTVTGMGRVMDMAPATMATAITATAIAAPATTAMDTTPAVITAATATMVIDRALSVSSNNLLGPVTIVVQSTE